MSLRNADISLPVLFTTFVAVLLGIGFALFPWVSDDLWYRLPFKECFLGDASVEPDEIWRQIYWRHTHDNSRLANALMFAVQFLPAWVHASLSGLAAFGTMRLMQRLGGFGESAASTALFCGLFALAMPWVDQMYVLDFQLNYLWGGAWMSLFLLLLLRQRCSADVLFCTGLLCGVWQECTALPAFVATVGVWLFYGRFRNERTAAGATGLLLGLMWLYFSPGGTAYRSSGWTAFAFRMNIIAVFTLPALVYTAMLLRHTARRRMRPEAPHFILATVAWTSGLVMVLTAMGPRTGWASVLASITGIVMLLRGYRSTTFAAGTALYGLALANLTTVCHVCRQEAEVYRDVVAHFRTNGSQTLFMPLHLREDAPLLALQKPQYDFFAHLNNILLFSNFYGSTDEPVIAVPSALREFSAERADRFCPDFYDYEGLLVGPTPGRPDRLVVEVDYGSGPVVVCYFATPFVDADGIERGWYHCDASTISSLLHPIPERITIVND